MCSPRWPWPPPSKALLMNNVAIAVSAQPDSPRAPGDDLQLLTKGRVHTRPWYAGAHGQIEKAVRGGIRPARRPDDGTGGALRAIFAAWNSGDRPRFPRAITTGTR